MMISYQELVQEFVNENEIIFHIFLADLSKVGLKRTSKSEFFLNFEPWLRRIKTWHLNKAFRFYMGNSQKCTCITSHILRRNSNTMAALTFCLDTWWVTKTETFTKLFENQKGSFLTAASQMLDLLMWKNDVLAMLVTGELKKVASHGGST